MYLDRDPWSHTGMSALPPPTPGSVPTTRVALPPVLPRQAKLIPAPPRRRFHEGYKAWHWALLIVGVLILAVVFAPIYLGLWSL